MIVNHARVAAWRTCFFLLFVLSVLATACTRNPSLASAWTECGSVVETTVSAFKMTSKSTGKVVHFALGPYTKYVGEIQGSGSLSPGLPVRVDAGRSDHGWKALSISGNQCGAPSVFQLTCEPAAAVQPDPEPGTSRTLHACSVTSSGGFYGAVDLSCANAPPDVTCSFDPNPITALPNSTQRSNLTIEHHAAGPYAGGTFNLSITALSAGRDRQAFALQVSLPPSSAEPPDILAVRQGNGVPTGSNPAAQDSSSGPTPSPGMTPSAGASPTPKPPSGPPGYGLSCSPESLVTRPGGHASGVCAVAFTGGFKGPVQLECPTTAPGISCTLKPDRLAVDAGGASVVTANLIVAASDGVSVGKYAFSVKGSATPLNRSVALTVNVAATSRAPDFNVSCSATELSVAPGGTAPTTCAVTRLWGFDQPVMLSCRDLPAEATCSYGSAGPRLAPGGPTATDVAVRFGAKLPPGLYTFHITGEGGGLSRSSTLRVLVEK